MRAQQISDRVPVGVSEFGKRVIGLLMSRGMSVQSQITRPMWSLASVEPRECGAWQVWRLVLKIFST